MATVASGSDYSSGSPQRGEDHDGHDGLHPARRDEHGSGSIEAEGGSSLRAHQGPPLSGKQAVERGYGTGAHEAEDVHLCSKKIMQEGCCDGVYTAQGGDSKDEDLMEEDFDDGEHGAQPDLRNIGEPQGGSNGVYGPEHGDRSCKQTLEEGDADGEAENAVSGIWRKHTHEDMGASGALGGSMGAMGEHIHGYEAAYGALGNYSSESTPVCGSPGQEAGHGSSAYAGVSTEAGQIERRPKESMLRNGTAGDDAHGAARKFPAENDDSGGNFSDFMSHPGAYAHGKGIDLKINISQSVISAQAPTLMVSSNKSASHPSGSPHSTTQPDTMKRIGVASRFGSAVFSLVAFSVIVSTSEKRFAAGSTFSVKFSDYQAYNYLAALNLLSCLYACAHAAFRAQGRSSNILSSPLRRGAVVYLCDQMLALLMISSSSSAATASELSRHGLHNIWPPACSTWKLSFFCSRAEVAVAMSFISFLFMLLSSFSSGYYLANLMAE